MQYCPPLDRAVAVEHVDHIQFRTTLEEAVISARRGVRAERPATPDGVVRTVVAAVRPEIRSFALEDQLELAATVEYPGEPADLPDDPAVVPTVERVLSTLGNWNYTRATEGLA